MAAVSTTIDQTNPQVLAQMAAIGSFSEVKRLLDAGVDPNAYYYKEEGQEGPLPLHECILHSQYSLLPSDHHRVLTLLIDRGANVNEIRCGTRPLHLAAAIRIDEVAQILLQAGADPRVTDDKERTPMDIAASHGNEETRRLLLIRAQELHIQGLERLIANAFVRIEELEYLEGRTSTPPPEETQDPCAIC